MCLDNQCCQRALKSQLAIELVFMFPIVLYLLYRFSYDYTFCERTCYKPIVWQQIVFTMSMVALNKEFIMFYDTHRDP